MSPSSERQMLALLGGAGRESRPGGASLRDAAVEQFLYGSGWERPRMTWRRALHGAMRSRIKAASLRGSADLPDLRFLYRPPPAAPADP